MDDAIMGELKGEGLTVRAGKGDHRIRRAEINSDRDIVRRPHGGLLSRRAIRQRELRPRATRDGHLGLAPR
jgi:hypothetical protein